MKSWEHKVLTEDELKEIVRGVYDCKYFTSLQCKDSVSVVFMPILFFGAAPTKPSFPDPIGDIRKDRKNKLNHFTNIENWEKEYKAWEDDTPKREKYIDDIGMVFEENSKAGPTSYNGYPIFMSCQIISKSETRRFLEKYAKYEKMREEFEMNF